MQASGVYNRYVNYVDTDADAVCKPVPGAPKKMKQVRQVREVDVTVDLHPRRLHFAVRRTSAHCPGAPKKMKQRLHVVDVEVDLAARRLYYASAVCPGAPTKLQRTRVLQQRENIVPTRLRFDAFATPAAPAPTRECPPAPRKTVKTKARTPLAWTAFTEADCMWNPHA